MEKNNSEEIKLQRGSLFSNTHNKLLAHKETQAGTLMLSYEAKGRIWTLLVRNHPLHRGPKNLLTRPFYQITQAERLVPPFQFPGGSIDPQDSQSTLHQCVAQKYTLSNLPASYGNTVLSGTLREFAEETGLVPLSLPIGTGSYCRYVGGFSQQDTEINQAIKLHVFHWHLGTLEPPQQAYLNANLKPGSDIAALLWYPLDKIWHYQKPEATIYAMVPSEGLGYTITSALSGLPLNYGHKPSIKYTLESPTRWVNLVVSNVHWLQEAFPQHAFQSYYLPEILSELAFERLKALGQGTHDNYLCRYVPTGELYILKYIKPDSALEKQLKKNAQLKKLTLVAAREDKARSELLAAELYRLHSVNSPLLRLVETEAGLIVASLFQADFKEDNARLEKNPPETLYEGFGCDLAFANYDAIGNIVKVNVFGKTLYSRPYNIGFIQEGADVIRIDVGASLGYRAKGAFKHPEAFNETIDIDKALRPDVNSGFYQVFSQQMQAERWQRAKACLLRATEAERTACVLRYGYGDKATKLQLAHLINQRVANTVRAIDQRLANTITSTPPLTTITAKFTQLKLTPVEASIPINPLADPTTQRYLAFIKELIKRDSHFKVLYQKLSCLSPERYTQHYQTYYPLHAAIFLNEAKQYQVPSPAQLQQDNAWADAIISDDKRSNAERYLTTLKKQRALFAGNYKINDVLKEDKQVYDMDTCPLAELFNLYGNEKYLQLLKQLSEPQRQRYVELLQVEWHRQNTRLLDLKRDVAWGQQVTGDLTEQVPPIIKNYEQEIEKITALIRFMNEQQWLLTHNYQAKNQVYNLDNAPTDLLARVFQVKYIILQFRELSVPGRENYGNFLNELIMQQKEHVAMLNATYSWAQEIKKRIIDCEQFEKRLKEVEPYVAIGLKEAPWSTLFRRYQAEIAPQDASKTHPSGSFWQPANKPDEKASKDEASASSHQPTPAKRY